MNNIKKWREQNNMSQQDLADILKINRSTIAKWETGEAFPRAEKLPDIARTLNCSIDELYTKPSELVKTS